MNVGKLTSKSNNKVACMRFTGEFGDSFGMETGGFGSVMDVQINNAGVACFSLTHKQHPDNKERQWAFNFDNEQRKELIKMLSSYEPTIFESYGE